MFLLYNDDVTLLDEQIGLLRSQVDRAGGNGREAGEVEVVLDLAIGIYRALEKASERVSADYGKDWRSAARHMQPEWVRWHDMGQKLLVRARETRARGIELSNLHEFLRACNVSNMYGPDLDQH